MHAAEVAGGVVALVVALAGLAGFAVGQERFVGGGVDGHPDLARLAVDAVGVAAQLMFAAEAIGIVGAGGALETQDSSRGRLGGGVKRGRGRGGSGWRGSRDDCFLGGQRIGRVASVEVRGSRGGGGGGRFHF